MTFPNAAEAMNRPCLTIFGSLLAILSGASTVGCSTDQAKDADSRGTGGIVDPSGGAGGREPADMGGASGAGGASPVHYSEVGVCGQRGQGTVDQVTFTGYDEFYIIGDEGFGDEICVVRFEVRRVGAAPDGCDDPTANVDCVWTHLVEYGPGEVLTDVDGVCANSDLGFDATRIGQMTGAQSAYGFVSEYAGHNSVLMAYDPRTGSWDAFGNATWDPDSGAFRFDHRNGFCGYGASDPTP